VVVNIHAITQFSGPYAYLSNFHLVALIW
jgi:ribA/ribD-fused uncharacterized protein